MRIFYILLSFILLSSTQAKSQARGPMPDPEIKIVKFYPNPAVSFITFEIEKESNKVYSLQIFNFLGRKVKDVADLSPKTIVNLSDLVRGIYIFQLKEQNGRVADSGTFQVNK
ncbi:MAG TPA: T9SS type A sorting domain-containing protein [Puia sp.]|nr:T9SS type A sorting domain-containing protein [Puia sp.]